MLSNARALYSVHAHTLYLYTVHCPFDFGWRFFHFTNQLLLLCVSFSLSSPLMLPLFICEISEWGIKLTTTLGVSVYIWAFFLLFKSRIFVYFEITNKNYRWQQQKSILFRILLSIILFNTRQKLIHLYLFVSLQFVGVCFSWFSVRVCVPAYIWVSIKSAFEFLFLFLVFELFWMFISKFI